MIRRNSKTRRLLRLFTLIFAFLFSSCTPGTGINPAQPVSADAIAKGNIEHGRDLFMGYVHFENHGPPCMGCHNVGNNGILGGGALGPDLTNVSDEITQTSMVSILSNFGSETSPVMEPIYTAHPLTVSEQADLIAFMNASAGEPEKDKELIVLGISILATVGAAIVLGFVYRNRLRRIRRAMVEEAQKELL